MAKLFRLLLLLAALALPPSIAARADDPPPPLRPPAAKTSRATSRRIRTRPAPTPAQAGRASQGRAARFRLGRRRAQRRQFRRQDRRRDVPVGLGDPRVVHGAAGAREDRLFARMDGSLIVQEGDGFKDALTGQAVAGVKPDDLSEVTVNNRLRGVIQGALGQLDPAQPGSRRCASRPRRRSPTSRRPSSRRRSRPRRSPARSDAAVREAMSEDAGDARPAQPGQGAPARRGRPAEGIDRSRRPRAAAAAARQPRLDPDVRKARAGRGRLDRHAPRLYRHRRRSVRGPVARQHPAARRDRPRHHLRRDGRHQHGAWRDDHARRLFRPSSCSRSSAPSCRRAGSTPISIVAVPVAFLVTGARRHRARAHA